jgi:hypothetical protein
MRPCTSPSRWRAASTMPSWLMVTAPVFVLAAVPGVTGSRRQGQIRPGRHDTAPGRDDCLPANHLSSPPRKKL